MKKTERVRLRVILPVVYVIISAALFAVCFLHLGHSAWCQYFLDSMFPAGWIGNAITRSLVRWRIVSESSDARKWVEDK